mmetsp:Transcript_82872/g.173523  ORF Transcript_82872/g.173523 Transcript_82872/m.173523 type:complete len:107 (+) Transcript_82872:74-394(+)
MTTAPSRPLPGAVASVTLIWFWSGADSHSRLSAADCGPSWIAPRNLMHHRLFDSSMLESRSGNISYKAQLQQRKKTQKMKKEDRTGSCIVRGAGSSFDRIEIQSSV